MTMIKTTLTKLLLLMTLICAATSAHAATTVSISGGDDKPVLHRFQSFYTGLSATVLDPPKTNEEATITGPTYSWSVSNPNWRFSTPDNSSTGLFNPLYPNYGGGGAKEVVVSCTATFTKTTKPVNGQTSPPIVEQIPFSNSKRVPFFVTVPVKVESNDDDPIYGNLIAEGSLPQGSWHTTQYNFVIMDNQDQPKPYTNGKPGERFIPVSYASNVEYSLDLAAQNAPGPEKLYDTPSAYFNDENSWSAANPNWRPESSLKTFNIGRSDLWYVFGQYMQCTEWNAATQSDEVTRLTPNYTVLHYRGYVERHTN